MKLESKFSIGDKVFLAYTQKETKQHPCPDCLGTKTWQVTSPAGSLYKFDCPRCSAIYRSNQATLLLYFEYEARAKPLTIGSVRTDTNADRPISYMCLETGVGSGSVYYEDDIFHEENTALHAAQLLANDRNKEVPILERMKESLRLSDYQLSALEKK